MSSPTHALTSSNQQVLELRRDFIMPEPDATLKTAREFEAAFIAQMLQFSGLAKALTTGGGKSVESFTQFYLEELAKDITNNGGFGIADKISAYIKMKEDDYGELGRL